MKQVKYLLLALILFMSGAASAQTPTKEQVQVVLEDFCQLNYDKAFSPKQYIENTLIVDSLDFDEEFKIISVKGKHSYRGQALPFVGRQSHTNVDFKAEIYILEKSIKVKFWKWYEADMSKEGHWEGPCENFMFPE